MRLNKHFQYLQIDDIHGFNWYTGEVETMIYVSIVHIVNYNLRVTVSCDFFVPYLVYWLFYRRKEYSEIVCTKLKFVLWIVLGVFYMFEVR